MIAKSRTPIKFWWIFRKDLVYEYRARQAWPRMLLLGIVVAFLLSYQMTLSPTELQSVSASLCWVTICFAAVLTIGQSIALEHEDGCWDALLLYPVSPETIYFAKLAVNGVILGMLQLVVLPFFAIVSDAPWLSHPWALLLVGLLANLGVSSVGTLLGAMSVGMGQSQAVVAFLLLPLLVPVMLAASEATRLVADTQTSAWWQWVQLLGAFAVVYVTVAWLLFAYVIED